MEFLLSHWHCILPIAAIGIGLFLMKGKSKSATKKDVVEIEAAAVHDAVD
jgi:hypothetical protein